MAYSTYPTPTASQPERPSTVTAIGVLGIAVGALGVLSAPLNLLYFATGFRAAGPMGPTLWENDAFRTYMLVNAPLGAVLSVLYIVAGVGLLRLRPWAWGLTVGLIAFAMVSQIVGACIMTPSLASIFGETMPGMPPGGPDMSFMRPVMYASVAIGVLIGQAIMIVLLVLLTRPNVRQAFGRAR